VWRGFFLWWVLGNLAKRKDLEERSGKEDAPERAWGNGYITTRKDARGNRDFAKVEVDFAEVLCSICVLVVL
jgi:hypothetical protein